MTASVISLEFFRECRKVNLSLAEIRQAMDREIARIDAETAAKRKRIEGLLTKITADLPCDVEFGEGA